MLIVAPTSFNWDEDELVVVTGVAINNNCQDNGGNVAGPCTVLTVAV
jgi:fructose-specific component phosphotransferase system IIB-like protein